jgi:hypothetical protein
MARDHPLGLNPLAGRRRCSIGAAPGLARSSAHANGGCRVRLRPRLRHRGAARPPRGRGRVRGGPRRRAAGDDMVSRPEHRGGMIVRWRHAPDRAAVIAALARLPGAIRGAAAFSFPIPTGQAEILDSAYAGHARARPRCLPTRNSGLHARRRTRLAPAPPHLSRAESLIGDADRVFPLFLEPRCPRSSSYRLTS